MKFTHWAKQEGKAAWTEPPRKIATDLPEGILSEEARHVFKAGHCHSFAMAFAKLTGGKMYGLRRDGMVVHVYVRLPNSNTFVDVKEKFEIEPDPHAGVLCPLPSNYKFTPVRKGNGWFKAQPEKAMIFAKARLAEIQKEQSKHQREPKFGSLNFLGKEDKENEHA